MYLYQADTYCDACGEAIAEDLRAQGIDDEGDSDGFPQWASVEATDSPDHCASVDECQGDAVDLRGWGLGKRATLYGAEVPIIGELLSDGLTEYGVAYLREMLAERPRTPYQRALHRFWREVFAEDLTYA